MSSCIIDGSSLTLDEFAEVCRNDKKVELSESAKKKIAVSRTTVDNLVKDNKVVYGVTTGFGKFSDVIINAEDSKKLQRNLIMTHAVGAGEPFQRDVVRGIMLLRLNSLAKGFSGISMETLNTLVMMLNNGVTPQIPQKGSLGASGDLAPLAHMVLPMIGLGKAEYKGEILPGKIAMERAGIPLRELSEKEGLALINGTQVMTSAGALALYDALKLIQVADIAAALSFEANRGVIDALDPRLHELRPHSGQIRSAEVIRKLLEESKNITRQGEIRVQDGYSLRCAPVVHGASRDALSYILSEVNIEMNSVTDNPIIFSDTEEGISGGNFHGQPMAYAFDLLGIAVSELADISERRIERLVNPSIGGFPAFLTEHGGLNSGFMIVQYSAASLVSENKILAHPASVDSIPSSANQEDHVSMGTIAARKAGDIVKNARRVLAMELMCACQAIDLMKKDGYGKESLGRGTKPVYEMIRRICPMLKEDRPLFEDINSCEGIILDGTILSKVKESVGNID